MNDFVNRQDLLDGIEELKQSPWFKNGEDKQDIRHYGYLERKEAVEVVTDLCIKKESPVTPKEKTGWIPVSERLPEEYGEYLITWITSQSKRPFIGISEGEVTGEYDHKHNRFKFEWLLEDYIKAYPDVEVIAWMPLPEPYKEVSE